MSAGVNEGLGSLLTKLGNEISAQLGGLPKRAYLYAACEDSWAQVALYVEEEDHYISYKPDEELFEIAMDTWISDNAKREKGLRWLFFDYDIINGKFKTHFVYPEELEAGDDEFNWPEKAVKKRFSDKPMIQIGFPASPPH